MKNVAPPVQAVKVIQEEEEEEKRNMKLKSKQGRGGPGHSASQTAQFVM